MMTRIEWDDKGAVRLVTLDDQGVILTNIPGIVTLRDAGRILKKSRRHLYRYIERGWIVPLAKFSGEYFLDPRDIVRLKEKSSARQSSVPSRLAPYFPDHDLKSLNLNRDMNLILTRLLERGTSSDLRWLKKRIPAGKLKEFIKSEAHKHLSSRALGFWQLLEGVSPSKQGALSWKDMGRHLGGVE